MSRMAGLESMVVEEVKPAEKPVDREKVTLRFILLNSFKHNPLLVESFTRTLPIKLLIIIVLPVGYYSNRKITVVFWL